jgi:hypothetical protein
MFSLYNPLRHVGGMAVFLRPFLTLALNGSEWLAFLAAFPPGIEPLVSIE